MIYCSKHLIQDLMQIQSDSIVVRLNFGFKRHCHLNVQYFFKQFILQAMFQILRQKTIKLLYLYLKCTGTNVNLQSFCVQNKFVLFIDKTDDQYKSIKFNIFFFSFSRWINATSILNYILPAIFSTGVLQSSTLQCTSSEMRSTRLDIFLIILCHQ